MEIFDSVRKYKVSETDSIIFSQLSKSREENVKEKEIIEKANIPKASLYKTLDYFEKLGFPISFSENKGIGIAKKKPRLSPPEFLKYCPEKFKNNYHYFTTLNSTHEYAIRLIKNEPIDESLIIAEYQSSGRGRTGRKWFSKLGSGILASIILDLSYVKSEDLIMLPIALSLSVAKTIKSNLSWPNDIIVNDKKIGGTLISNFIKGDKKYVVLSLGLNVFGSSEKISPSLKEATTMDEEGMIDDSWENPRATILENWIKKLDTEIKNISNKDNLFKEWSKLLIDRGKKIFWIDMNGKKFHGEFIEGCWNGNAFVRDKDGNKLEIKAEETPFYSFK